MDNLLMVSAETMSSREIAVLLSRTHANIKISAERLASSGTIALQESTFDHLNNQYVEYLFNKRDSIILVAQNCPEFTAVIVDRWQELETQADPQFQIPKTLAGALRLAADQEDIIETQAAKIAEDAPKVDFVNKYMNSDGLRGLTEAAKSLGFKPRQFTEALKSDKFLYYCGTTLVPIQKYLDKKIFKVIEGVGPGDSYNQTKITSLGMNYFAQRYSTELGL